MQESDETHGLECVGQMKTFVMTKYVVYMVTSVAGHYKAGVVFEATVLGI
jgi:hypothetical protein